MRILNISLRNLNSLAGEWNINLDDPSYTANGIFAVTGPTGAGKSTILDAICLALYGQTPRLGRITKGGNEIMSRQTGNCFANVTFESSEGRRSCCWSQNRARNHPSGALQQPIHKLFDGEGREIKTGSGAVLSEVERLTGMNFERFTKSMVLAQGRFASFLLSGGSERAPLLEQLTGTEIYAEISHRVFERCKAEEGELKKRQEFFDQVQTLSPEERAEREEKKRRMAEEKEHLDEEINRITQLISLNAELDELRKEKERLRKDQDDFAPDAARLRDHDRANPLRGLVEASRKTRDERIGLERELEGAEADLPRLESERAKSQEVHERARLSLEKEKEAQTTLVREISAMRELDGKLRLLRDEDEKARKLRAEADSELEERRTSFRALEDEVKNSGEELEGLRADLQARARDASLAEDLAAMREKYRQIGDHEREIRERGRELADLESGLERQKKAAEEGKCEADKRRNLERELSQKRDEIALEQERILEGKDVAYWREKKEDLAARRQNLESALDLLSKYRSLLDEERNLGGEAAELDEEKARQEDALKVEREKCEAAKQELRLMERALALEEERLQLQEGHPCPLCGATHHPWAGHAGERGAGRDRIKQEENELSQSIHKREIKLAGLESQVDYKRKELQRTVEDLQEKGRLLAGLLQTLSPVLAAPLPFPGQPAAAESLSPILEQAEKKNREDLERVCKVLEQWEEREKKSGELRLREDEFRKIREEADPALRQAENALTGMQVKRKILKAELETALARAEKLGDALGQKLLGFGFVARESDEQKKALEELATRCDSYVALQKREKDLQNALTEKEKRREGEKARLDFAERQADERRKECERRKGDLERGESERRERFGERDADAEEKRMKARLEEDEKDEVNSREALSQAVTALETVRQRRGELKRRLEENASVLQEKDEALRQALSAAGFPGEADCLAAMLPEEESGKLKKREWELSDQEKRLTEREKDTKEKIEKLRPNAPDESAEELEGKRDRLKEDLEGLLKEYGKEDEILSRDNEQRAEAEKRGRDIAALEKTCALWKNLNDLIGSQDGGKYRKYVQALTFRRLIACANRQLSLLTDRYLLVPHERDALELNVIDRYQADLERSARNLSGGESFIVSLSLALGLAQMASHKARVDSVFLDEGFGSLDEEALDTALSMLSDLRQHGKVIGVISHVQNVKDRIAAQIQVTPIHNGCSEISGPGVTGKPF